MFSEILDLIMLMGSEVRGSGFRVAAFAYRLRRAKQGFREFLVHD